MVVILFDNTHFIDDIFCSRKLVYDEQYVTDVDAYCSLKSFFEYNIAAHGFPVSVKCRSDKLSVSIKYRTTRISAGNIVIREEVYGHFSIRHGILTEIFVFVEFF